MPSFYLHLGCANKDWFMSEMYCCISMQINWIGFCKICRSFCFSRHLFCFEDVVLIVWGLLHLLILIIYIPLKLVLTIYVCLRIICYIFTYKWLFTIYYWFRYLDESWASLKNYYIFKRRQERLIRLKGKVTLFMRLKRNLNRVYKKYNNK